MKKIKLLSKFGFAILAMSVLTFSCTDLEIEQTDSVFTDSGDGFSGVEDVPGSLINLYNQANGMLGDQANFFALTEVTTDEQLVPTRGTDWGDNGIWRTLHAHTWAPTHGHVLTVWNQLNQAIFLATEVIDPLSAASAEEVAHAKFIRAFNMYWVMDMYGQVPFRAPNEGPEIDPMVMSRTEAFAFVEQDLIDALAGLPAAAPGAGSLNQGTKAAANFLLARLYLNAHVYKGTGSADNADMAKVIAHVDAIEADGFALQAGFFEIFSEATDTESIWHRNIGKSNRIWNGLHYNQVSPDNGGGGWNGFTTLAEFYDLFEGDPNTNVVGSGQEERRGWVPDASNADDSNLGIGYGFLLGQQYAADGTKLQDRAGNDLIFTKELPGLIGNGEADGMRLLKYHPAVDGSTWTEHEIVFRYADAHLMRAEAMMRSGTGDATAEVNTLRTLRGANPLGSVTESDMLAERGREMYVEWIRRTDLIRFGEFTRDWPYKDPASVGDVNRTIFPIPSNAILSNPNLVQNPGY